MAVQVPGVGLGSPACWDCGFESVRERGAWLSVSCEYWVLSGRGLCDGPIFCPEESYRVRCVSLSVMECNSKSVHLK